MATTWMASALTRSDSGRPGSTFVETATFTDADGWFDFTRTRIGAIAISAAAMNDVAGWILLALIGAAVAANLSLFGVLTQIAGLLAYVLVCWYGARPLLLLIVRHLDLGAQKLTVAFWSDRYEILP
jgi:hypothetical protein